MKMNVEMVFTKKFRNKSISLKCNKKSEQKYEISGKELIVNHIKIGLGVLRCFGQFITKLSINYGELFTYNNLLDQYVTEYCSLNMKEFSTQRKYSVDKF